MAGFVQNDMSGSLFRNDRKQQQNHPDHTGTAKIDGKEYFISAWVKTSGAGNKYFSLAFSPKEQQAQKPQSQTPTDLKHYDDDIPF